MFANHETEHGHYIVENGPEYEDKTIIKMNFIDDSDNETNFESRETSMNTKKISSGLMQPPKKVNTRGRFYHPLKSKVADRVKKSLFRIGSYCSCELRKRGQKSEISAKEMLEFVNVLNNVTPITKAKIVHPIKVVPKTIDEDSKNSYRVINSEDTAEDDTLIKIYIG
jgi:hypothetical protein